MKNILIYILVTVVSIYVLTGCADRSEVITVVDSEQTASENISEEQALNAIKNYCYSINPDLESIVDEGNYPVYWDISSSDENEIVILFRSYTGAQNRYYIDRNTGDTYVTEFVPGIMDEEERTDEMFSVNDFNRNLMKKE